MYKKYVHGRRISDLRSMLYVRQVMCAAVMLAGLRCLILHFDVKCNILITGTFHKNVVYIKKMKPPRYFSGRLRSDRQPLKRVFDRWLRAFYNLVSFQ